MKGGEGNEASLFDDGVTLILGWLRIYFGVVCERVGRDEGSR